VANRTGRLGLVRMAMRALVKRLERSEDFDTAAAKNFQVETQHDRLHVANDGELCYLRSPLRYRVISAALSVVVPRRVQAP
jgi:diacylglycerol kinase family enzyme